MPNQKKKSGFKVNIFIDSKIYCFLQKHGKQWKQSKEKRFQFFVDKKVLQTRLQFVLSCLCDFPSTLNIRFCDAAEMQQSNIEFRGKHYPTDVLSFPAAPGSVEETSKKNKLYALGDILVCVPVCELQAKKARHSLAAELEKMLIHGIVHLKGLDHERNESAWKVMTALENALATELQRRFGKPSWSRQVNG